MASDTTTTPGATIPNLSDLRASNKTVSNAIDEYYQNNPISSWIKNYKQARELDYINQEIQSLEQSLESKLNPSGTSTTRPQTIEKAFKNQFGSDILNVHGVSSGPDTFYMVFANKGCLEPSVINEKNTELKVKMCDAAKEEQLFRRVQSSASSTYTGVSQLQLKNNPKMCLTFDRSGLSVQPCENNFLTSGQNFKELYQSVRY